MLAEHNVNSRAPQVYAKKGKLPATKEPLNSQKENRTPVPVLGEREERGTQGLVAVETRKIRKYHLDDILAYELQKTGGSYRGEFLKRHNVLPDIRARMVNLLGRLDD